MFRLMMAFSYAHRPRPTGSTTQCVCPDGYTGTECETIDVCSHQPCGEGTCYDDVIYGTTSHCDCNAGWMRDPMTQMCTTQLCDDGASFCMHGGRCNADGDGCNCPDNTAGVHCEDSTCLRLPLTLSCCRKICKIGCFQAVFKMQ